MMLPLQIFGLLVLKFFKMFLDFHYKMIYLKVTLA